MNIVLFMGIFWSIYGILGLFGVQRIPPKYKGKKWTKSYIRCCGVSWMLLGFLWLAFYLAAHNVNINYFTAVIILIAVSIPAIIFTFAYDRKYKTMLMNKPE
ncbi:MAG: hypothetical protein J1E60_08270 [Christensenellaceae bacterium]|nr:hypothetical protein [Christensenellaceae bacterium]